MSFDVDGINYFKNVLPRDINSILHSRLLGHSRWNLVTDNLPIDVFQMSHGGTDAGSIICSYRNKNSSSIRVESEWIFVDDDFVDPQMSDLNFYADLIQSLIIDRSIVHREHLRAKAFENINPVRYFWNYYHSNSVGIEHTDIQEPNHWSIIYYLNDNPGTGTRIIKPDGEEVISPQIAGDAVMFPSHWVHNGVSPQGNTHRCCLNILFKARYCFDSNPL